MIRNKLKILSALALATTLILQPIVPSLSANASTINTSKINKLTINSNESIIDKAISLLDTKYAYGGNDPNIGFDSPGFTEYIYKTVTNIDIGRDTYTQSSKGIVTAKENLKPGDLVFTNGGGHVGIFIDQYNYIHATPSGVKITPISNFYKGVSILDSYVDIVDENLLIQLNKYTTGIGSTNPILKSTLNNLTGSITIECNVSNLDGIEELTNIDELTIISDAISTLSSKNFTGLSKLKKLKIDGSLTTLDNTTFKDLINLESLDLSNNNFREFNYYTLDSNVNLLNLNLANNNLFLFNVHRDIPNLKTLDLSSNDTRYMRDLHKFVNLENLSLSNNYLSVLPSKEFFGGFNYLKSVDLTHNNISHVESDTFSLCPSLTTIDISYNSINDLSQLNHISDKVKYNNQSVRLPYHFRSIDNSLTINLDVLNNLTLINGEKITSLKQLKGDDNFVLPETLTNNEFTVNNATSDSTILKVYDENVQVFDLDLYILSFNEAVDYVTNFDLKGRDVDIEYGFYKNAYSTIKVNQISVLEATNPGITNKLINIKNIMSLKHHLFYGNIADLDYDTLSLYVKTLQEFDSDQLLLDFSKVDELISKDIDLTSIELNKYNNGKNKEALKSIKEEFLSITNTLINLEALYTENDTNKLNTYKEQLKNLIDKTTEYLNIVVETPNEENNSQNNNNSLDNTSNKLPSTGQEALPVGLVSAFLIALGYKLTRK